MELKNMTIEAKLAHIKKIRGNIENKHRELNSLTQQCQADMKACFGMTTGEQIDLFEVVNLMWELANESKSNIIIPA